MGYLKLIRSDKSDLDQKVELGKRIQKGELGKRIQQIIPIFDVLGKLLVFCQLFCLALVILSSPLPY